MITFEEVVKKHVKPSPAITKEDRENLKKQASKLFGVEMEAKKELLRLVATYPVLDLGFLNMRTEDGWPRFAVFSIDSPKCYFEIDSGWPKSIMQRLQRKESFARPDIKTTHPAGILNYFDFSDIFAKMAKIVLSRKKWLESYPGLRLSEIFKGILSQEARQAIADYKSNNMDYSIYIIAEAGNWSQTFIEIPPRSIDPLVIAYHPDLDPTSACLLAKFDLTIVEEYVAREFSIQ